MDGEFSSYGKLEGNILHYEKCNLVELHICSSRTIEGMKGKHSLVPHYNFA